MYKKKNKITTLATRKKERILLTWKKVFCFLFIIKTPPTNFLFFTVIFIEEAQQFDDEWKTRAQPHMHGRARIEMPRTQYHSSSSAGPALAITAGPSHNHHYQDADRSARRHSNHSQG